MRATSESRDQEQMYRTCRLSDSPPRPVMTRPGLHRSGPTVGLIAPGPKRHYGGDHEGVVRDQSEHLQHEGHHRASRLRQSLHAQQTRARAGGATAYRPAVSLTSRTRSPAFSTVRGSARRFSTSASRAERRLLLRRLPRRQSSESRPPTSLARRTRTQAQCAKPWRWASSTS